MTHTETHPVDATRTERCPQNRPKGVLFCPTCGHESPVGGDWHVDWRGDTRSLTCPECRTLVSDR
ncbi:phage terminase large subunit family protein [Haloarcula marina]|uniref:phage terminase large subunit family protein n=1 Tax=Haloarcula marina TaxID=2961574 RepID=UPI0020B6BD3A|nr:phage terminase large subunit family protein [Halomicroarcula marina]